MDNGLFIRLYLDADVDVKLAPNLRQLGFDCISARELGHQTLDDDSILTVATEQGRVVLTHNTQHFTPLVERWWFAEQDHAGVVVSEQIPLGELQRRILHLLNTLTADEMKNNIRNLSEFAD